MFSRRNNLSRDRTSAFLRWCWAREKLHVGIERLCPEEGRARRSFFHPRRTRRAATRVNSRLINTGRIGRARWHAWCRAKPSAMPDGKGRRRRRVSRAVSIFMRAYRNSINASPSPRRLRIVKTAGRLEDTLGRPFWQILCHYSRALITTTVTRDGNTAAACLPMDYALRRNNLSALDVTRYRSLARSLAALAAHPHVLSRASRNSSELFGSRGSIGSMPETISAWSIYMFPQTPWHNCRKKCGPPAAPSLKKRRAALRVVAPSF